MIRTAYTQGFVDAAKRFHINIDKLAQFGGVSTGATGTATLPSAATQPQMAPTVPPTSTAPAALPTAPLAPNAKPTL